MEIFVCKRSRREVMFINKSEASSRVMFLISGNQKHPGEEATDQCGDDRPAADCHKLATKVLFTILHHLKWRYVERLFPDITAFSSLVNLTGLAINVTSLDASSRASKTFRPVPCDAEKLKSTRQKVSRWVSRLHCKPQSNSGYNNVTTGFNYSHSFIFRGCRGSKGADLIQALHVRVNRVRQREKICDDKAKVSCEIRANCKRLI